MHDVIFDMLTVFSIAKQPEVLILPKVRLMLMESVQKLDKPAVLNATIELLASRMLQYDDIVKSCFLKTGLLNICKC